VGNAQILRKLEAVENSLMQNSKVILPSDGELVNVIGELAGIVPVTVGKPAAATSPSPGTPGGQMRK
jgi:ribonucleotide monophosphatase NagD (HAD superfamily)